MALHRSSPVLAPVGSFLASRFAFAAAARPLDGRPLDAARYCNRSRPAVSCSVVCRIPDDRASARTGRGAPVCSYRRGEQT